MSSPAQGDTVRRHLIETLTQRARLQPEPVRRVLEGKLAQVVAERHAHLGSAQNAAPDEHMPAPSPLADLLSHIAQQTSPDIAGESTPADDDPADLKSLRHFRDSWSKLSTEQSVAQALATGPANAGPLNSHALILRSLELMRETAPAYLSRFISYADALLWLERANACIAPTKKSAGRAGGNKRQKT